MSEANSIQVSVSVLSTDFTQLPASLEHIRRSGADSVHLDIMDGHFVPNISFGWSIAADIVRASTIPCSAHLMIERPEDAFQAVLDAGVVEVLFHIEATRFPYRALDLLRRSGLRRGVAVNPATPVAAVIPLLNSLDTVLLMSVEPGFGGQKFLAATMSKVRALREAANRAGVPIRIAVDGGVDASNAAQLRDAGATELSVGSAFFRAADATAFVHELRGEQAEA
jgi:ribulose-phosphate 3-epimerase